jgi:hypothetical protein
VLCVYRTRDIEMAQSLCGDAYQCQFDYALSLNRDMAHFTRNYLDSFVNIRSINRQRGNGSQRLIYPKNGTSITPFINVCLEWFHCAARVLCVTDI